MEELAAKEENQQVLKVLEALKQASHELQSNPRPKSAESNSHAIKALLELETESDSILSTDPSLSALSYHLSSLKTIVDSLEKSRARHGLRSFLTRRVTTHEISRVAGSIESEIQAWIDRESIENLAHALAHAPPLSASDEKALLRILAHFQNRLSQGFNRELQDLILKSKVFSELESVLINSNYPRIAREQVAFAIDELIRFNKDVFVGKVLMGQAIIRALISLSSSSSLKVLCSLIKSTKSPLVDEIESTGDISKIINLLKSEDLSIQVMAMNCMLEIGYFGRKEAIDAMIKADLIGILVDLQRSELGGDLIEMGKWEEEERERGRRESRESRERRFLESHPFASCVARFAVQLEVGEGLRQREKRAVKLEILEGVREACISDAEAATIVAEVLWGSSP
ncbi:Latent-transforming growth factor beta-binding protein like [Actinidia chinensis var. chinensis]|uniref:Latent-transforming growth factor beta-binding protein like n=1 Tax=Actinidia chinensis var. chinensis TaxID=1590841 RepID=A0A2R6S1F8_ACTCC|nr:Latent-transforming growth factor beta-binding protein like [Actinidia chinensis var. chinensis]